VLSEVQQTDKHADRQRGRPKVDDAPHVRSEPHGRAAVGLILADQDWVRNGQQPDQRAVLQKLQDLRLIRQSPDVTNNTSTSKPQ